MKIFIAIRAQPSTNIRAKRMHDYNRQGDFLLASITSQYQHSLEETQKYFEEKKVLLPRCACDSAAHGRQNLEGIVMAHSCNYWNKISPENITNRSLPNVSMERLDGLARSGVARRSWAARRVHRRESQC